MNKDTLESRLQKALKGWRAKHREMIKQVPEEKRRLYFEHERELEARITELFSNLPLDKQEEFLETWEKKIGDDWIKAGLHLESQKFPLIRQLDLFSNKVSKDVKEYKFDIIGIDITQAQRQAVFAVQKLLHKTDYKGNAEGKQVTTTPSYNLYMPILKFTPAEYLETYGVNKPTTARGKKEFSGEGRRQALKALTDLGTIQHLFVYKREYFIEGKRGKKEQRIDRIQKKAPLWTITHGWEGLTDQEDKELDDGRRTLTIDDKLKMIGLELAPIFVDQIDTYFLLKHANYYQEIKLQAPHASKYVYQFIDYLITQAELKRRRKKELIIEIGYKELAVKLRMDSWIKTRNWKQIRNGLKKCYEIAHKLDYLLEYKTIQGKTKEVERLVLNPDKFHKIKNGRENPDENG